VPTFSTLQPERGTGPLQLSHVAAAGWRSARVEQLPRGERQGAAQEFVPDFASGSTLADREDPCSGLQLNGRP